MEKHELAKALDGSQYPLRIAPEFKEAAKAAGLVIVFGASDDLMEFEGAIDDELDCYGGGTAYLTSDGLLDNKCSDEYCPYFARERERAATIEALWCDENSDFNWSYRTSIPHETFSICDGEYMECQGIVFSLADVPAA